MREGRDWNYHGYHEHTGDAAINNDISEPHVNNNFPANGEKPKHYLLYNRIMELFG